MVYKWSQIIHSALFPATCVLCAGPGARGLDLCPDCRAELPALGTACPTCAAPATYPAVCGQCLHHPPPHTRALALFEYAPPVNHLLYGLKFGGRLHYARVLGELFADRLARRGQPLPERIIPVPLHPHRLRSRGFNQAVELARPLVRRFGLSLELRHCRRTRATPAQARLDAEHRADNVRGAFTWTGGPAPEHVAIFDDVITTGNTVGELARELDRHGAQTIEVWGVARAATRPA